VEIDLKAFAERSRYRPASAALFVISYIALAGIFAGVPSWLCFLIAAAAWIALATITLRRLRDGGLSGAWILLMILKFGVGPDWHLSDYVTMDIGGSILACVPIILGWIVPAKHNGSYSSSGT
jgi:uncharacterized membrane protein YhaH (DUF805 family)